ncbi:UDP-GlcNAc:betaGal beta-1,3-N-acetylglucosaminyltransferase-like protein 1 isoform X4 [Prionailurus viverrinus]|uniref:UDP-GlcNAc:betaGal beta-1,3-N-acetylglucosaminyltransferase-like protein 1 isoform X4 n=1 Tax=Prionailurus viverrinus TaxID=61388 RepID=UPI001FF1F76C|nr:UDP-GlcNAc:betaGal beta-1,3-N-acetylglucosaminyltransferase-like protein 1 isoform X4 [Prionailurus viverrinus]
MGRVLHCRTRIPSGMGRACPLVPLDSYLLRGVTAFGRLSHEHYGEMGPFGFPAQEAAAEPSHVCCSSGSRKSYWKHLDVRPCVQIVGCQVRRDPPNSTERYTRWINQLAPDQLLTQVFTSNGPTVIMPTWFCSRAWFSYVGPFDEGGKGEPEDLLFFYSHLRKGGGVIRVDQSLLLYRYHPNAATHSVLETTIWTHRVRFLEEWALPHWATFTIWNAGRQGRRLYRSLTAGMRRKVVAFCDVDENKIRKGFYCHEDSQERPKPRVPILHFRAARPPFVICVKLDLTGGAFEDNLRSLHLQEGRDFLHFS